MIGSARNTSLFAQSYLIATWLLLGLHNDCSSVVGSAGTTAFVGVMAWIPPVSHHCRRPGTIGTEFILLNRATNECNNNNNHRHKIDYQKDYGRGIDHLTADLQAGDVVVYQTGTWYVDGVAVGTGEAAAWEYCLLDEDDCLQIVWSHNCEHGVVRGWPCVLLPPDDETDPDNKSSTVEGDNATCLLRFLKNNDEMVEFGPEQVVARIPSNMIIKLEDNEEEDLPTYRSLIPLSDDLWKNVVEQDVADYS